jgi:nitroreductase/FMN reductase (NADPH)/FMN reductase [NAD(P)H]
MNEILKQLHDRKSVRVYEDRPIAPNVKRAILEAALQAPTAGNMALYTILDITDQAKKDALSKSCDNQPFIATAPMVLIFCADYRRWYDTFCLYEEDVRQPAMGDLFLAQADALIAAQNAVVAAESLGVGSCYIGDITENYEFHRELLNLPRYVAPAAMLCFGYPTRQQQERTKPARFDLEDMVHENGYHAEKAALMRRMLTGQTGRTGEELADCIGRFCKRKWNSDFSREMSRSCAKIAAHWCGDKE